MSPLLFMLVMEMFNRIIKIEIMKNTFHYHPRCRAFKLSQLSFADDLLLFCKADAASVTCLTLAFSKLAAAPGLQIN